jgi:hypothetical protein
VKCPDGEQATMRRRVGDALGLTSGTPDERGERGRVQAMTLSRAFAVNARRWPVAAGRGRDA